MAAQVEAGRGRALQRALAVVLAVLVGASGLLITEAEVVGADEPTGTAQATWGLRTTYRNYINGPIAHGTTVADQGATWLDGSGFAKGPFTWPVASVAFDPVTEVGEIAFDGRVSTAGHDYGQGTILELELSDLGLTIAGDVGTLHADLRYRPFVGASPDTPPPPVETADDVPFATVDLSGVAWPDTADGVITIDAAPATGVASTMSLIGWDLFYSSEMPDVGLDAFSLGTTGGGGEPEPEPQPIEVTGAQLEWGYSQYAQYGVFGPWSQTASGPDVSLYGAEGGSVSGDPADVGVPFTGARFDGGTGTLDPGTGAGTITWETGDWVLNAYQGQFGAPDETLRHPQLTIEPDGSGYLTVEAYIPAALDMAGNEVPAVGPERVTIATFDAVDERSDTTLWIDPDFEGRPYVPTGQTDPVNDPCGGIGGSWPKEWIEFVPSSVQLHYYTTSCSGLNLKKPPLPFTVKLASEDVSITQQPTVPATVDAGTAYDLFVGTTGNPAPSGHQWEVSTDDGVTWSPVEGATSFKHTVTPLPADDGDRYRVVVSGPEGPITSDAATLDVVTAPPAITTHPGDVTVTAGANATIHAAASGKPAPTLQWQRSDDDGATWIDLPAPANPNYLLLEALTTADSGARFRVVADNGIGEPATSNAATLTVNAAGAIVFNTQPTDQRVGRGQSATFHAGANATPAPTYQWQRSTDGGETWSDVEGATSSSYTTPTTTDDDSGTRFRAVASNGVADPVTSDAATLTVVFEAPTFTAHPTDRTAFEGGRASFSYSATTLPSATRQWQRSTDDGETWVDVSPGGTSSVLSVSGLALTDDGNLYRIKLTNAAGEAVSNPGLLTVLAADGTRQLVTNPGWIENPAQQNGVGIAGAGYNPPEGWNDGIWVVLVPTSAWEAGNVSTYEANAITWTSVSASTLRSGTGTFTASLVFPALDPTQSYHLITYSQNFSDRSWDSAIPISFEAPQPDLDEITDATFEWSINPGHQQAAPNGACNYFIAGKDEGYRPESGDVLIIRRLPDGTAVKVSEANRCDMTDGQIRQSGLFTKGTGTRNPATGEAAIQWSGSIRIDAYGGLVPWYVENPKLVVDASGSGRITARVGGFGASMESPGVLVPLDPVEDVVVADLSEVDVESGEGFAMVPDYAGIDYYPLDSEGNRSTTSAISEAAKARFPETWGSWPESFVDFQYTTGLSTYWHTSDAAGTNEGKPPLPVVVAYDSGIPARLPAWQTHPATQTITHETDATFTALAESAVADGEVSYSWQAQAPGSTEWVTIEGESTSTLVLHSVTVEEWNGAKVRAVATNSTGSLPGNPATLTVRELAAPVITTQPTDLAYIVGHTIVPSFQVRAMGYPAVAFQWQRSYDGGTTWEDWEGKTAQSLSVGDATSEEDWLQVRAVVSNGVGEPAISDVATLRVLTPNGTKQAILVPQPIDPAVANTLRIAADGFVPVEGETASLRMAIIEAGTWQPGGEPPTEWAHTATQSASSRVNSGGRIQILWNLPADRLDGTKSYELAFFSTDASNRAQDFLVPVELVEPPGPVEVEGVQLRWAYNQYAQYGVFGPWSMKASGSNVGLTKVDGQSISGDPVDAGRQFNVGVFDGGTGTLDPVTGAGTITWDTGDWVLNAYSGAFGAPDETLRDPILTIGPDGSGTLSFEAYIPAALDMSGNPAPAAGPERIVLATFDSIEELGATGLTIDPGFEGRPYVPAGQSDPVNLDCDGIGGSWPGAWIDFVPASVQAHYYTTSCSGLNLKKPPLPFEVDWAPADVVLRTQPSVPATVQAGSSLNLSVVVDGNPLPIVTWERSFDDGATWTPVPDAVGSVYPFTASVGDSGARFRAVLSSGPGDPILSDPTGVVTVTTQPAAITSHPFDQIVGRGDPVTFSAGVTGAPPPSIQWQRSDDDGTTWADVEGATSNSYQIPATAQADDGARFRVQASNGLGDPVVVTSNAATLSVVFEVPEFVNHPPDRYAIEGGQVSFPAAFRQLPRGTTQWQSSTDGGETWVDVEGATIGALNIPAVELSQDGTLFRLEVTNAAGTAHSNPAKLTVFAATGPNQVVVVPDADVDPGEANTFTVLGAGFSRPEGTGSAGLRLVLTDSTRWQPGQLGNGSGAVADLNVTSSLNGSGRFTQTVAVPADRFDPELSYGFATWLQHEDRSLDTWTPISFAEPTGPIVVTGAQLAWGYSQYAQYGVFGAWRMWSEGPGVSITQRDGQAVSGDPVDAGRPFNVGIFDGGTGTIDPGTGAGTISWDTGDWVINAYPANLGAPDETYSDPVLTIGEDGSGTLSMVVTIPAHADFLGGGGMVGQVGPERKVVATFDSVDDLTSAGFSVDPDFEGRTYTTPEGLASLDCEGLGGSWPAELIDFLPGSVRPHYFTTSCSGLNLKKPPLPFDVSLTPVAPSIVTQPTNPPATVPAGADLGVELVVAGNPTPAVQWQRSLDDGATWVDVEGATGGTYPFTAAVGDDGARFRALVGTGGGQIASDPTTEVAVTTEAAAITFHPEDLTVGRGELASFGVGTTGAPPPSIQWQRSDDDGSTWVDIDGATTASYRLESVTDADSGARFRAVVTNGYGDPAVLTSDAATLTVLFEAPQITTQPTDRTTFAGLSVTFDAAHSAVPAATRQWQVSTDDGTTWVDVEGATAGTHSLPSPTPADDGNLYRVVVTNAAGEVASEAALLTVLATTGERRVVVLPEGPIDPAEPTTIQVLGEGYLPPAEVTGSIRVAVTDTTVWQPGQAGVTSGHVVMGLLGRPALVSSGGLFSLALSVPPGALDPAKDYGVALFSSSTGQRYWDTWAPLELVGEAEPEPGAIEGIVTAPGSGEPLEGVCAYLYAGFDSGYTGQAYCTGADGRYAFLGVDAGERYVAIYDPQARFLTAWEPVTVPDGATVTEDIALEAGASIAGRITDATSGEGIEACVYLYEADGEPAGHATCSRPDGYYALPGVPDGSYKVGIGDPTGWRATSWSGGAADVASAATVSISAASVAVVDAALAPLARIELTPVDGSSTPVAGTCLYLYDDDVVDLASAFALHATCVGAEESELALLVPAGTYKVVVFDPGAVHQTTWIGGTTAAEAEPVPLAPGLNDLGTLTLAPVG